jgi:hypothetical protein
MRQFRQPEFARPGVQRVDQGGVRGITIQLALPAQQAPHLRIFFQRRMTGFARPQDFDVDARGRRHQRAAGDAMRDRKKCPQRRGQSVYRAEPDLRQRDARHQCRIPHPLARHGIAGVGIQCQQAVARGLHPAPGERIGQR